MTLLGLKVVWIRFMMALWGWVYKRVEYIWVGWRIRLYMIDNKGSELAEGPWYKPIKYEPTEFLK